MTSGLIVQLPVSVPFGTDEEFDLRVRLERELAAALTTVRAGEYAGGEIDTSHMKLRLGGFADPTELLALVKDVLSRHGQLWRATIALETPCAADPDDKDWQVVWPPNHTGVFRVA